MPEVIEKETTATEVKDDSSKVMSVGKTERINVFNKPIEDTDLGKESDKIKNGGAIAKTDANEGADKGKTAPAPPDEQSIITEEQLTDYFNKQGIKYEGIEKFKEKANYEPHVEPTQEQKDAAAKAKEVKALNKFIESGRTGDEFYAIKSIVDAEENQFSINLAKTNLMKAGLTEEEATDFVKEKYFQVDDAEIEQEEDEIDREYKKRLKGIFSKQLTDISTPIKTKAAGILADLYSAIDSEDLQAKQEVITSAKIDDDFKALPRKLQIEIGEIGGKTVSPVDYEVSETDLAESKKLLKDAVAQRNNFLYNQDGSLNITNLSQIISKAKAFDSAAKVSFLEGMDRMTKEMQKVFPAGSAQELGVGGSSSNPNGNQNGKVASFGKIQRVKPYRN